MQENIKNVRLNFIYASPKSNLGTFLLTFICIFLLIMATFTQLPLSSLQIPTGALIHPIKFLSETQNLSEFITRIYYIPQIPTVLFIAAFLGRKYGFLSILGYIAIGLFGFPVFASGGGLGYYSQQGFGYILSYLAAVFIVSKLLHRKISLITLSKATVIGVFSIHLIGALYMTILLLFEHQPIVTIIGWIWILSAMQIIYDLILSFISITLGCIAKSLLWIIME